MALGFCVSLRSDKSAALDLGPGWKDAGNAGEGMAFCHTNVLLWGLHNSFISLRKIGNPLFRPSVLWKIIHKIEDFNFAYGIN